MRGYVILEGEETPIDLAPGPRFADGRRVAFDGAALHIEGEVFPAVLARDGDVVWIHLAGRAHRLLLRDAASHLGQAAEGVLDDVVRAPMPGVVVEILVRAGSTVAVGDALMVIESMKLETTLRAERAGVIAAVEVETGQSFARDVTLITLVEAD